ncbi:MAG TPA: hypothetical protein VLA34_00670, partial [Candidatus Krumholzibacterium sp.]|nr:hypothetical protein [Candidatus Krumholzibacterium sp.]
MSRSRSITHFLLTTMVAASVLLLSSAGTATGQCIISNPSFEIGGSGGAVFGGWNQFGYYGSSDEAVHGSKAARVTGPDWGVWEMSGYWQEFDTAPGEQWVASAKCWHTDIRPLTGSTQAKINIEWRDSAGNLMYFESHLVASSSTPTDEIQDFSVTSGPAPSGVAKVRLLLGVLQYSGDPQADVYYDLADFNKVGTPYQWSDFPGGNTLDFSGRTWRVKGPGYYGPGPNNFCDNSSCTWVDGEGRLHVTVKNFGGTWYSTEVVLEEALGYGDYLFTTVGRLDQLDPSVVLGIFLWQYGPCWDYSYLWWNPYNEMDIEFSRWGDPGNWLGQFVAQPYDWGGNIDRFDASFSDGELTTHAFRWGPDAVEFR